MGMRDDVLAAARNGRLMARFSQALTREEMPKGTKPSAMIGGLAGCLIACIKAAAPPQDWREAAEVVCSEIKSRLTEVG